MKSKVDRVLSNQTLSSTVSLLTSNIPFPWFLVLGCNREAPIFSFFSFADFLFDFLFNGASRKADNHEISLLTSDRGGRCLLLFLLFPAANKP